MHKLTQSMLDSALSLAAEVQADAVLFDIDCFDPLDELSGAIEQYKDRIVCVTRSASEELPVRDNLKILEIPNIPLTRMGQIKMAIVLGVAEKIFERSDLVVCLTGIHGSGKLDMITVIKVGEEPEIFLTEDANPVPPDVQPVVFERILSVVSELAAEGRERRPVGTIFVLGDSEKVLENSRQLVFNPFHGYPEEQRNILTGELDETLKEFSAIDGAFIIRGDGCVLSAGRYLMGKSKSNEPLRSGLGTRHEAACAITAITDAVAIVLSQSTSTITIFASGKMITEIEKIRAGTERMVRSPFWNSDQA